jgi:hypothetical protein
MNANLFNVQPTRVPIKIQNANGTFRYSTHTAEFAAPSLPVQARTVHIVPELANANLLSVGQLCDAGCEVTFTATTATVHHHNHIIMNGSRDPRSRLWTMSMERVCPPVEQANASLLSATPAQLVAFAHASLFSPALSTLEDALRDEPMLQLPGLTLATLKKYPPNSLATPKGHLDQTRQNTRSTKGSTKK